MTDVESGSNHPERARPDRARASVGDGVPPGAPRAQIVFMRARNPACRDEDMRGTISTHWIRVGWRCSPSGVLKLAVNPSYGKMVWLEAGRGTPLPNSLPDGEICSMKGDGPSHENRLSRGARGGTPRMSKSIAVPMVERAWTRTGAKDKRDRGQRSLLPPQRPSVVMKLNENK